MLAIGNYRLALHPGVDPGVLEAKLAVGETDFQVQLTRITSSVTTRLLRRAEPGSDNLPSREYTWEVSIQLMSTDVRYRFGDNLERLQESVKDCATVLGVEVFAVVDASTED